MRLGARRLAIGVLVATVLPAAAQEYCVVCSEPAATYRCVIAEAKPGAQSLQASCLTALKTDGGHAACEVKRGVTVFECDAPVKRVAVGDVPVVLAPPAPPTPDPKAPPATVLEAVKRAQAATDKSMQVQGEKAQAAADATADFFKKSLTCLGSLFTKC